MCGLLQAWIFIRLWNNGAAWLSCAILKFVNTTVDDSCTVLFGLFRCVDWVGLKLFNGGCVVGGLFGGSSDIYVFWLMTDLL